MQRLAREGIQKVQKKSKNKKSQKSECKSQFAQRLSFRPASLVERLPKTSWFAFPPLPLKVQPHGRKHAMSNCHTSHWIPWLILLWVQESIHSDESKGMTQILACCGLSTFGWTRSTNETENPLEFCSFFQRGCEKWKIMQNRSK